MPRLLETLQTAHHKLCMQINTAFVGQKTSHFSESVALFEASKADITRTLVKHYYEFYLHHDGDGKRIHADFIPSLLSQASRDFIGSTKLSAFLTITTHCTALLYPAHHSAANLHELNDLTLLVLKAHITQNGEKYIHNVGEDTYSTALTKISNIIKSRDFLATATTLDAILRHYRSLDERAQDDFADIYAKQNDGSSLRELAALRWTTGEEEKEEDARPSTRHGSFFTPAGAEASSDESDSDDEENVVTSTDIATRIFGKKFS